MSCPYCRGIGEHDYRCPLWKSNKNYIKCCYCNEDILLGEKYLENLYKNEYIHEECVDAAGIDWTLNWLGFNYKEMEDYNE